MTGCVALFYGLRVSATELNVPNLCTIFVKVDFSTNALGIHIAYLGNLCNSFWGDAGSKGRVRRSLINGEGLFAGVKATFQITVLKGVEDFNRLLSGLLLLYGTLLVLHTTHNGEGCGALEI